MRARHAIAFGLVVTLMAASSASAYVLLSPRRTWPGSSVNVRVNHGHVSVADSDQGITAVVNALNSSQAWNGCSNAFTINATKNTGQAWVMGDGIPTVSLRREAGGCNGSCLAATYIGFYTGSTITDADVEGRRNRADANGGPYYSNSETGGCTAGEYGVEGIWVHEAGHQIGLAHSNVSGATMYPSVSSCNQGPASVAADDCAGMDDLY